MSDQTGPGQGSPDLGKAVSSTPIPPAVDLRKASTAAPKEPDLKDATPAQIIGREFGRKLICLLGVIALVFLLAWGALELIRATQLRDVYADILRLVAVSPDGMDADRIGRVAQDVRTALDRKDPPEAPLLAAPALRTASALLDDLLQRPDLNASHGRVLSACKPALSAPATDTQRQPQIDACLAVLDFFRFRAEGTGASLERFRQATELAKQFGQSLQDQRTSWLQLANLILLNLLLPLLTAVFGYAFGRDKG